MVKRGNVYKALREFIREGHNGVSQVVRKADKRKKRPTQLSGHQLTSSSASRQNRDKKLPKRESKSATFSTVG